MHFFTKCSWRYSRKVLRGGALPSKGGVSVALLLCRTLLVRADALCTGDALCPHKCQPWHAVTLSHAPLRSCQRTGSHALRMHCRADRRARAASADVNAESLGGARLMTTHGILAIGVKSRYAANSAPRLPCERLSTTRGAASLVSSPWRFSFAAIRCSSGDVTYPK
jgi:hypothetical protein